MSTRGFSDFTQGFTDAWLFCNHLSTTQNTLSRLFTCFCVFTIPQISFIQHYVPTGNIAMFGCMIWPMLQKCQTSSFYLFFLYSSDFLPRAKDLGFNINILGFFLNISEMQSVLKLEIQQVSALIA